MDLTMAGELRAEMSGKVLTRDDDGFAEAGNIWNGAVNVQPALFALCETASDVQAAVRAANKHDVPLSVRGGGHDWAGRSLRHNGLVIDLTRMRGVEVDAAAEVATVQGGAQAGDLTVAAAEHGLAAVTGIVAQVGLTGLTLGGGYGVMSTRYGLALDNMLGAEVVLADGRLVTADETQNADLFWAVRGGGGNFGVVTSMRVRLHPVRTVVSGPIIFPWNEAAQVLQGLDEVLAAAPDDLGVTGGIVPSPQGGTVLVVSPTWFGEAAAEAAEIAKIQELGHPVVNQIGPVPYAELTKMADAQVVNGRHNTARTRWLASLPPGAISALVAAGDTRPSPFSVITWQYFHGAAARVPLTSTAFGLRSNHYMFQIIPAWEPGEDGAPHRAWADKTSGALAAYALPGGYPNLLVAEDHDQVAHAYGDNAARLREVKQQFDPANVFSSATPLPD
ncbi:FAD-binding oxidoreductase [Actinoplanes sp. TBRC 11911]|uniref:FAD-binding oxidoreductase n=1 Tax=Actinoplanes sp. TBRC 11911 TaxID=2729386 RepID=UPI00145FA9C8|nr:FAD-binding oxidoreductase [Actinoplanes sp. TBRC 11911]NMO49719.1 FAD-binding oxidoreductase [Actinoplanes sp. TBRC 11911]